MLSQKDYLTLMMKAQQSFRTSETRHTKTQYHIAEDHVPKRGNVSSDHYLEIGSPFHKNSL